MTSPASLLKDQPVPEGTELTLRILETTDVHANLLAYDYHADRPVSAYGLVRTATLIREARAEAPNTMLFDNGDFLQGTPLSDLTAQKSEGWRGPHPVIATMNALNYDAAGLGNHEFNFGLDWLTEVLAEARFPLTCANALTRLGEDQGEDISLLPPYLLLPRQFIDATGRPRQLSIGVIGLVPPQITTWDQYHLAGRIWARGIVETARFLVPRMRAEGADLVIALAHTGIDPGPETPMMENAALPLAQVPGIDAVLAGHSHQVYPEARFDHIKGADVQAGTLHQVPTIMAGFRGSHLGVMDLGLTHADGRWTVTSARSQARPVLPKTQDQTPALADEQLRRSLQGAHQATIRLTRRQIGETRQALHSYLALVGPSPAVQLVNAAQRAAVMRLLPGRLTPDQPILSATASYKTGGRGGPWHFSDVPAGPLNLRHAADLYPFPNVLCVLAITGADLRDWLERAASVFHQITPGQPDQTLLNPHMPGHMFDVIDGVEYQIDLSAAAPYDVKGCRQGSGPGRIRALTHHGQSVADGDRFVIATNSYRAFGGGPYTAARSEQILFTGDVPILDLLTRHIGASSPIRAPQAQGWRFAPLPGTTVQFETGPGLRDHPDDIRAIGARDLGDADTGFARFSLPL